VTAVGGERTAGVEGSGADAGTPRAAVVVLAAGEGRRVGADTNKVLLPLAGSPVFTWSLRAAADLEYVDAVVVVVREADRGVVQRHLTGHEVVVPGGDTRHGSEWNALQALAPGIDAGEIDVVAIHDSARPLASPDLFRAVVEAAASYGGALPVREQPALVPRDGGPRPVHPVAVQTPQAFRARPLLDAYRRAERDGFVGTDTASCVERYTDLAIHCVPSPATNLKITFPEDVALAERLLRTPC
jgi:2-C-methyl-D-erythritol 4-phosphate cytidylyltransferase